ncbi:hypothetical protein [Streptomyces chiangmaiensis]|uniref:Regulatory protein n=1 Tax=Streptomyces chiangmaiensis TaxID=766497 RepID=A0ABU7FFY8_9ACTN|nr:hypothetical protein [Streptomyces chiangmaiensis]MED7823052.1 hypothetical protein [Streptomyces chiangmaiensis]
MSQSTTAATGLTSQYAAQVSSDLEHNVKEQERISTDIASLQEELASLQRDHSVLVNVQQALGVTPAPVRPAATPDHTTVPAPREKAPAEPGTGKRTRAKKSADSSTTKKAAAEKPASKPTTTATSSAAKAAQPTLVELIRRHLTEQSEPRSAAEVATTLGEAHPERGIKTTVVRTTLENLVARNHAQRTKQGTSVYYTAPAPAGQAAAPAEDESQPEQAE